MPTPLHRRRGVATLTAAMLASGTAMVAITSLSSAAVSAPAADCAEPFPVASLQDGDLVTGKTVSRGVTPDDFTGEVLGVLDNGIAPGLDMIIMDLDSQAIQDAGGIWAGMSGSPVYAEDGRLIGAVAYGLSWGSSPIAGVTPFEEMDNYLGSSGARPARHASVNREMAKRIAGSSEVSRAQAEQGFDQLDMATGVSGIGASRLAKLSHSMRSYFPKRAYAAGRASAASAGADDVVAGGNLAASFSFGDITFAGVGTATSVCDGEVVGFGHPFNFVGRTSMSLHPASAIYVQPESLGAPFKVANIGAPVGTIDEDRLSGISGFFGATPPGAEIASNVTYADRFRVGTTTVTVPDAEAMIAFYQQIANHDRVLDAISKGSEDQHWTIQGTHKGVPFTLERGDRFTSAYDISFAASYELSDIVYLLSKVPDVDLTAIEIDSALEDDTATYRVVGNEQRAKGAWTKVNQRNPARVKAGKTLRLRTVLRGSDGTIVRVPYTFKVPKRAIGQRGYIYVEGGNSQYSDEYFYDFEGATTFDDVVSMVNDSLRNDGVRAVFDTSGGPRGGGAIECRGCRGGNKVVHTEVTLGPVDRVVDGFKRLKVIIG